MLCYVLPTMLSDIIPQHFWLIRNRCRSLISQVSLLSCSLITNDTFKCATFVRLLSLHVCWSNPANDEICFLYHQFATDGEVSRFCWLLYISGCRLDTAFLAQFQVFSYIANTNPFFYVREGSIDPELSIFRSVNTRWLWDALLQCCLQVWDVYPSKTPSHRAVRLRRLCEYRVQCSQCVLHGAWRNGAVQRHVAVAETLQELQERPVAESHQRSAQH